MPRIQLTVTSPLAGVSALTAFRDATGRSLGQVRSALQGQGPLCDDELASSNQRNAIEVLQAINRPFALQLHRVILMLKELGAAFAIACDGESITEDRLRELVREEHRWAESWGVRTEPGPFGLAPGHITVPPDARQADDPLLKRLAEFDGDLPGVLQDLRVGVHQNELGIVSLDFRDSDLTDSGLLAIRDLQQLQTLRLGTWTTDAGLAWLGNLRSLQDLDLTNSRVQGSGLAHLAGLTALRRLSLARAPLDDEGLRHLPELEILSELDLDETPVTDAGLAAITGRRFLNLLSLKHTNVTGRFFRNITGLALLRTLFLDGTDVSAETLDALVESPASTRLTTLSLAGCPLTDDAVTLLAFLPELQNLVISRTGVTDRAIDALIAMPKLKFFDLRETAVSETGLLRLRERRPDLNEQPPATPAEMPREPLILVQRPDERRAAEVENSWQRIEKWLAAFLPEVNPTLRPPAREAEIREYETLLGRSLPDDVKRSWLIHDGQSYHVEHDRDRKPWDREPVIGLIFGFRLMPLGDPHADYSSRSCWEADWGQHRSQQKMSPHQLAELNSRCSSSPDGMIRNLAYHPAWVPIYEDAAGNYVGIDLDPGPAGVAGQVINFGCDQLNKHVLALSWAHFLEDFADELESGHAALDEPGVCSDTNCRFALRGTRLGWFGSVLAEWSRAKIPRRYFGRSL